MMRHHARLKYLFKSDFIFRPKYVNETNLSDSTNNSNKLNINITNLNKAYKKQNSYPIENEFKKYQVDYEKVVNEESSNRMNSLPNHSLDSDLNSEADEVDSNKNFNRTISESNQSDYSEEGSYHSSLNGYSSLNPALHEQTSQSKQVKRTSSFNNSPISNLDRNKIPGQEFNSNTYRAEVIQPANDTFRKPFTRTHLPLKASASLPHSSTNNYSNYRLGKRLFIKSILLNSLI